MEQKKYITGKPLAWLLTLVYFTSYLTRINFAAVLVEVIADTGFGKSALSVILVVMSVTYGVGQLISGRLGDKLQPTSLILFGLAMASVINILMPFCDFSVPLMTVVWAFNGFAQAMMWPPIVKILVGACDEEMYGYSVVRISWGSSLGTIAVYLISPLIIGVFGWQGVLWSSAGAGVLMTLLWAALKRRIPSGENTSATPQAASRRLHFPKAAVFPMVFIVMGIILQGMLRDGVTNWMPTYLAEVFDMGNQSAIFSTVVLAVFSLLSFAVFGAIYKRFFKNEVLAASLIFGVSALISAIFFFFFESGAVFAIFAMALICACMHGINLMLITHVPKRFKKYGNISTIAGAVNACTYIGAAIFTYGIAVLSERIGWQYTVCVWALISLVGAVVCIVAARPWNKMIDGE